MIYAFHVVARHYLCTRRSMGSDEYWRLYPLPPHPPPPHPHTHTHTEKYKEMIFSINCCSSFNFVLTIKCIETLLKFQRMLTANLLYTGS